MKPLKSDVVSWFAILVAAGASAAVYTRLPEQMETHFSSNGTPNGWMSRPLAASFIPVTAVVVWALSRFSYRLSFDRREDPGPVALSASITTVALAFIHFYLLGNSLGIIHGDSGRRGLLAVTSLTLVALGLVAPRVRRNPFVGTRTFWTLVSEENWARTARVGGMTLVLGGLASVVSTIVLPQGAWLPASLAFILMGGLFPMVYSVYLARVLSRPQQQ